MSGCADLLVIAQGRLGGFGRCVYRLSLCGLVFSSCGLSICVGLGAFCSFGCVAEIPRGEGLGGVDGGSGCGMRVASLFSARRPPFSSVSSPRSSTAGGRVW